MEYEKIIRDHRGTIRIVVRLITFSYGQTDREGNTYRYDVNVWHKAPRKKNEIGNNNIASLTEILEAKHNLWKSIKP